jgi:hypothetical protein
MMNMKCADELGGGGGIRSTTQRKEIISSRCTRRSAKPSFQSSRMKLCALSWSIRPTNVIYVYSAIETNRVMRWPHVKEKCTAKTRLILTLYCVDMIFRTFKI